MASKIWKVAKVVVSILLLMLGFVIAALGVWVLAADYGLVNLGNIQEDGLYNFSKPGLLISASAICIVVGVLMCVVSIMAFCGVRKESKCILAICAAFLFVLLLLDAVVIVLTAVIQDRINNNLHSALVDGLTHSYDGTVHSKFDFSKRFDRAQVQLECCGVDGYEDFRNLTTAWAEKRELVIPRTCCVMTSKSLYLEKNEYTLVFELCPNNRTNYHTQPCYSIIKDTLVERSYVLLGVSVVIAALKIIGLIIGICLLRSFKDGDPFYDSD